MPRKPLPAGLPTSAQVLDFIQRTPTAVGKREIAKAFGLHGADKIALKAMLRDMADSGALETGAGRTLHKGGGLPKVAVLRVIEVGDGETIGTPDHWNHPGPPPRIRIIEGARRGALGLNDRVLARIEESATSALANFSYRAFPMKTLAKTDEFVLGILRHDAGGYRLIPVDKRARSDLAVLDAGVAQIGDLVLAEPSGRPPRQHARIVEVLGDPFAPRSFSLIAIHAKGIPHRFSETVLAEAVEMAKQPLGEREDLRALPLLTIDPADARDHDDAVWATADNDPANPDGWKAIVAIADVSFYVRPGTALDKSARDRGNSVYFPDRVVPMLPEILSADACSLIENADRAVLACHLTIASDGQIKSHRFARATIRCVTNIAYEEAQASIDAGAGLWHGVLSPLWGAWGALAKARAKRAPLDLDLPERRVELDETGKIVAIVLREALDAHRLIEDFMIAANVAAALALEAKKTVCMYRVHETPGREKLVALKDYLETFGIAFTLGQVIQPRAFNTILAKVKGSENAQQISEQVLRTQTQAYYSPDNKGHFGLALASYGHFTSPIRRYADLLVHRALVRAYVMGEGGLSDEAVSTIGRTAEHISQTERRAMEAERDTIDRYVASYLSTRIGETLPARITGVQRFGFFATVVGIGGDGLVPVSTLGDERFVFNEDSHMLEGIESGTKFVPGQRLDLRLADANPITGSLRFELPLGEGQRKPRNDRVKFGRRAGQSRVPPGVRRGKR